MSTTPGEQPLKMGHSGLKPYKVLPFCNSNLSLFVTFQTFYISEQVSHHPPISAFYVTNRREGFTVASSILAKSKFYGNSTSAILEGVGKVRQITSCHSVAVANSIFEIIIINTK